MEGLGSLRLSWKCCRVGKYEKLARAQCSGSSAELLCREEWVVKAGEKAKLSVSFPRCLVLVGSQTPPLQALAFFCFSFWSSLNAEHM